MPSHLSRSTKVAKGRVECPIVKKGCGSCYMENEMPVFRDQELSMVLKIALSISSLVLLAVIATPAIAVDDVRSLRLYTLDCGRVDSKNLVIFSVTVQYNVKAGAIVVCCL